jgi:hypothetical protein
VRTEEEEKKRRESMMTKTGRKENRELKSSVCGAKNSHTRDAGRGSFALPLSLSVFRSFVRFVR